jgi:hypothetical protein
MRIAVGENMVYDHTAGGLNTLKLFPDAASTAAVVHVCLYGRPANAAAPQMGPAPAEEVSPARSFFTKLLRLWRRRQTQR